jgi:hypothetical protein
MVLTPQQQPKVRRVVRRRNKVLLAPASASCAPTQDDDEEQVVEDKENVKPLANRLKKMRLFGCILIEQEMDECMCAVT